MVENNSKETNLKLKRHRSPNYPYLSLKSCVELLQKFIKSNKGFSKAHMDYTKEHLGYTQKSSRAERAISSMIGYGLLESDGSGDDRYFKPTELAKKIYQAEGNNSNSSLFFKEAALNEPEIMAIWEHWKEAIPGRGTLEKWLQASRNYSEEGAKRFAYVVLETYEFANLSNQTNLNDELEDELEDSSDEDDEIPDENIARGKGKEKPKSHFGLKEFRIPIDDERDAFFYAPTGMTELDYDDVIEFISFLKKRLARKF